MFTGLYHNGPATPLHDFRHEFYRNPPLQSDEFVHKSLNSLSVIFR